ncbi:MAG: alpha/beta hydrolase [Ilumatobacteraceae bacterium]
MTGTTWRPDVLADFEHTTLAVPFRGSTIDAVVVRRAASPVAGGAAVLYVHGFGDYFFQTHLAAFYEALGVRFYALDLRRHGRALRKGQLPNFTADIDEYLDDVSAAIGLLQAHEGVEWLLLNGHSTGGLVAALYAHRGPRRSDVDAVFLNSPFLDMNLPAWQEAVLEPVLSAVGRIVPSLKLPGLSSLYGESLHADHRGEWSFDLAWKPLAGFPARAGWFRAIHRAQAEVAGGLSIAQPVLLLHAGRSAHRKEWNADVLSADIVLDVADMERLAPGLGSRVEVGSVDGGIHDLVLSREPARARTFELLAEWLRGARS